METNLNSILRETEYPVTFIIHVYSADIGFDQNQLENDLTSLIGASEFSHPYSLSFVGNHESADCKWDPDILHHVKSDHGLVIISLASELSFSKVVESYSPDKVKQLSASPEAGIRLYAHCMMASEATKPSLPSTSDADGSASEASLKPRGEMLAEMEMLDREFQLFSTEKLAVYLFQGQDAPAMMQLIGAARAVAFAAIGAGAGKEIDLSEEDDYYHHLLLWDREENCLVGAYRLGFTTEILNERGQEGMYLDHVFEIQPTFYEKLGNAMELSRSFVLPSYQKNPQMLDALWKGIGHAAIEKNCFILYGSVTISASFTPLSQAILVDTLDRFYSEDVELRNAVRAKVPFEATTQYHNLVTDVWAKQGINKLNKVILDLEDEHRSIPPLIRYYVSLGAKFMSFQVEESFNNAIYCLLKVDLNELPKRYKKRFLGEG